MELFKSIILGIVQGLTEFLPVSSSGHLVILPYIFGWDFIPVYYAVILHFATLLSLVTVFFKDIWLVILWFVKGIFIRENRKNSYFKLGVYIIAASIPAAVAGFFLEEYVESFFSRPFYVACFLVLTSVFLILSEYAGKKAESSVQKQTGKFSLFNRKLNFVSSFIIGIGQAIAIFPGLSRSGTTISFARVFGIKREECVKFSFLLSVPVILGAFIFEMAKSFKDIVLLPLNAIINISAGFIFSFASGVIAIKLLLNIVKKRNLNFFAIYCFIIAVVIFTLSILRKI
jgi:undecaprenyl-diphosphatase